LKGSAVIEKLIASEYLKEDSTRLWQMRLGQVGLNFVEAFAKLGLLEGIYQQIKNWWTWDSGQEDKSEIWHRDSPFTWSS